MKQRWTRLERMVRSLGGNTRFMESRFEHLFVKHHKNACEIVYNKEGQILAAVYFTPIGSHQEWVKNFMRSVRDRVQYGMDQDADAERATEDR